LVIVEGGSIPLHWMAAYDAKNDRLFVTGKQWPTVFEIKVIRQTSAR
jgi:hypothetical protein